MKIKSVTRYIFKGKEYSSLEEIKEEIHNTIGEEVLDRIEKTCPPQHHKDFIKMLDILCDPAVRKVLIECYNVTFEQYELTSYCEEERKTINVLDI
jgi:hypothetical protein